MKILIRLVGYSETENDIKSVYEYQCKVNTIFNFEILKSIFNKYEHIISPSELDYCTLTCNSKNLKKDSIIQNSQIDNIIVYRVFIFTGNTNIKNKLINIFKQDGFKVDLTPVPEKDSDNDSISSTKQNINKNDKDSSSSSESEHDEETERKIHEALKAIDSDDEESDEETNGEINFTLQETKQNLELFKDEDFLTLLKIYKYRSYLFNDFYKYINSSQIIKFNKNDEEIDHTENLMFIKELDLGFSDEQIANALQMTGNHINLSVRYLLFNK
jgi:hypothetical protein